MARSEPSHAAGTPAPGISPMTIQQKEFRVSRLGGYKMRDVDEFLDEVTEAVGAMQAEIERLRSAQHAPVLGTPDLGDVGRQADEIIERARAEAARITASARIAGTSDAMQADAVRAFLDQERSFLYDLGELVQTHAGSVKEMARSARSAGASPRDEEAPVPAPAVQPESATDVAPPRTDEAAPGRAAVRDETRETRETRDAGEPTIRIDEPIATGSSAPTPSPPSEGSLRDLFWGNDEGE